MLPEEFTHIQEAIRDENLDGWLFCNFRHRDKLSDELLHINPRATNSRLWFYAVPARGEPLKVVHAIEQNALDTLPGTRKSYISREELIAALKPLEKKRWGVHSSPSLTAISYLDAGTSAVLEGAGLILVSAAALIQRFKGLLNADAIKSHEKAARHLYEIVDIAWDRVKTAYHRREPLREGDLRLLIQEEMAKRNLVTGNSPIVAAGADSGNPHYDFSGSGAELKEGDVVQFDISAKDAAEGAVYADISWVGVFAAAAPPEIERAFADLISVREGVYRFIEGELREGRRPSGAAADREARSLLINLGYSSAIRHRTGHGIDTECHGSGVNIDSVEFPDSRLLLDGSCFSLEPGIYFSDFGLRTEIDVYILAGKPVVSGKDRQFQLLTCQRDR
ncbi:MAG: aminopeptidase P family protein [Treponema sp.]|jgi:Xaa-Pro aminopeptidase|nr:aminopeptidase P family protein [Treponema sp.]